MPDDYYREENYQYVKLYEKVLDVLESISPVYFSRKNMSLISIISACFFLCTRSTETDKRLVLYDLIIMESGSTSVYHEDFEVVAQIFERILFFGATFNTSSETQTAPKEVKKLKQCIKRLVVCQRGRGNLTGGLARDIFSHNKILRYNSFCARMARRDVAWIFDAEVIKRRVAEIVEEFA